MKAKKITALLLSAVMSMGLAACGATPQQSAPPQQGQEAQPTSITLCESWEFTSGFAPVVSAETSVNYGFTYWNRNCYDTLVVYNDAGEIEGSLAKSWETSEDGLVYTFHLREGVTFSDGEKLTAQGVIASFQASIQLLGSYNGSYGKLTTIIDKMEAPDELTFVLTLTQPYYGTLNDLSMSNPLGIMSPAVINNDLTLSEAFLTGSYGTGPYMYTGDFTGDTYTFTSNPNYWGEKPAVDSFRVKVIGDNDAKILALRSGEIDAVVGSDRMSADGFTALSAEPAFGSAINGAGTKTRYLGYNLSKAPFDDVLVRQAAAYAVDQQIISEAVFGGTESAAETLFSENDPYCNVEQTVYETDTAKAATLLEQAGWTDSNGDGIREKNGQSLTISVSYTQSLASVDNMALTVKSQLEAVGFSVELVPYSDMMGWYTAVVAGDYSIALWYTYGGAFDPGAVMTNMAPEASSDIVANQWAAFFDGGSALIAELDSTADEMRIQEIYTSVLQTLQSQSLLTPLTYQNETALWNSEKISSVGFSNDPLYVEVARIAPQ